jgi:MoaA/NifB/PqqE/SkfB family radical SAM enzyme
MTYPKNSVSNITSVDITAVWSRCHPHLRPLTDHLPLAETDRVAETGGAVGTSILAHVRFGADLWTNEPMKVVHFPDPGRFFLDPEDYARLMELQPALRNEVVTAVNARLWFSAPTFLNLEPTTRCNFNCWYCIGRHMRQEDILIEDFSAALDNFPALRTLALVGEGEPLMHKGFFAMAAIARARGIRVMIISNGSTLSQSIVRQLCEHEIAYIGISIDSADAATFASSRLDGKLEQVWRGIERLRDWRDSHGCRYPRIGLKGSLFAATETELPEIVAAAKAHGVDIFESFQPLNPMKSYVRIYPREHLEELALVGRVAATIARDSEAARRSLPSIAEFCVAEGIDFAKDGLPNRLRNNCDEQWIYALLGGDVTPCCQIKTPISPRWNLFHHSIDSILADPDYENVRFNLWNGLFPTYCDGCWKTAR